MKGFKAVILGSVLIAALLCAACLAWRHWDQNTQRLVPGAEQSYIGVVSDRAMSEFHGWPRGYISIELEDGSWLTFWEERGRDSIMECSVGDLVEIESAVEEDTGELVALSVRLLEKNQ